MANFERQEGVVYIGDGVKLTGVITAQETVVVDGVLSGEITCKHLVVGTGGVVSGRANVMDADIYGNVSADIVAKRSVIARASAKIEGHWVWGAIIAERGAILNGVAGDSDGVLSSKQKDAADGAARSATT